MIQIFRRHLVILEKYKLKIMYNRIKLNEIQGTINFAIWQVLSLWAVVISLLFFNGINNDQKAYLGLKNNF